MDNLMENRDEGKPAQETTGPFACPRFGKLVNGCKFEARYDSEMPSPMPEMSMKRGDPSLALEALKSKIYVRDVCIRCGRTVER